MKKVVFLLVTLFLIFTNVSCLRKYMGFINNKSKYTFELYVRNYLANQLAPGEKKEVVFFAVADLKQVNRPLLYELKVNNKVVARLQYAKPDFDKIGWEIILPADIDTSRIYEQYPFK